MMMRDNGVMIDSQVSSENQIMRDDSDIKDTREYKRSGGMTDTEVKKRAWVKNVAIIFLAVMLILTFFSNTIMNRSLPEVAAQYTTSGSITARIRGTGNVIANENFEVKITGAARNVTEVPVRVGDEVEIGDELIKFAGTGNEPLEEAEAELRARERELEEMQLELSLTDSQVANASRAVQSARNDLTDAQRRQSSIQYSDAAYNSALSALNTATTTLNNAQTTASARAIDLAVAQAELEPLESAELLNPGSVDPAVLKAARDKYTAANIASIQANGQRDSALATFNAAEATFNAQASNRQAWNDAARDVRDAQLKLANANADLTAAQQSANVNSSLEAIMLREKRREVEEARAKVESMRDIISGSTLTSLVGGIVTAIEIQPLEQANPDAVLMVIEVIDRGYSLSFSVTAAQASRVNVGDQADVDRGWYWRPGEELRATLINIRNDPANPMANRILRFDIAGDVKSGDQLNLVLAQRSENYNIIVPISAIRTDTNGDFVLVVIPRSSPLGNRYIATRADVNVLSTDDTHAAVSGALTGWDFVITTSSAPIDPGMQVRLADNP